MEFWIFIVISIIVIILISIAAFIVKCVGYKKVFKKIRTLSMSSANQHDADAERGRSAQEVNVVLPAPPAYAISFQHPVIARSAAVVGDTTDRSEGDDQDGPEAEINCSVDGSSPLPVLDQSDANAQMWSGAAFPGESIFVPPPYCLDPPSYSEVTAESDVCAEGSMEAPTYTA